MVSPAKCQPVVTSGYNRTCQKSAAPPFIRLHFVPNQGQWMGTEAKSSFLSLNKRPLRQIFLPRLISFGLSFFFFLAPHEGICGRGQTLHLIKDTFHISSPLSPLISLFTPFSCLSPPLFPPLSFLFLIIHHREPKGALRSYCTFFWLALDAF